MAITASPWPNWLATTSACALQRRRGQLGRDPAGNGRAVRASEIAERALLGAILIDRARLADVQEWLEPGDFYAYRHGLIYIEILKLHAP